MGDGLQCILRSIEITNINILKSIVVYYYIIKYINQLFFKGAKTMAK